MKARPQHRLRSGLRIGAAWLLLGLATAGAQEAPPPPTPAGGSTVVQMTRPLWTEAAITIVMLGLALYAVCRNSNRT